jgi:putative RecB family exonuclease
MTKRKLHELAHLSHSSKESLERCAKAFYLRYMTDAPRRPALWSAGGSAVHEATEKYDTMALVGQERAFHVGSVWERLFALQLDKAYAAEPNEWNWGRAPSEPIEVWNMNGPAFVQAWIDWRERSPYELWTTPDGQPAIELDVSGRLPGCPVEIKGYVDRIFRDPVFDKLIIVDLKTGKRPPKGPEQFAVYGALVKAKYGVQADLGVPFMNRKATLGKPYELAEFTPEAVGKVFGETWDKIQAGEFPANGFPGACFVCDLGASCFVNNGPLAHLHDPDHPANEPIPF